MSLRHLLGAKRTLGLDREFGRAKAMQLRQASTLIKVPDRFLNVLAQQPPFICSHHTVPRRPLGRLRIWRRGHDRHDLRVAITVERLLHTMLSTHETAIEALPGLL